MRLSLVARSPNNQRWRAHSRLLLESSAITHFFLEHFPLLLHGFGLPDLLLGLLELLVDVALAWSKGRASVACAMLLWRWARRQAVHRIGSTDPGTDRV